LSIELHAENLFSSQAVPQAKLGVGGFVRKERALVFSRRL
jgi:hypothetical protein